MWRRHLILFLLCACGRVGYQSDGRATSRRDASSSADAPTASARVLRFRIEPRPNRVDDFVAYVAVSDNEDLADHARSDGSDLEFFSATGAPLPFERVAWDPRRGSLRAWVRIPRLESSGPTDIYLSMGTARRFDVEPAETWRGYRGVWHLDALPAVDSTSYAVTGEVVGAVSVEEEGVAGRAARFDGTTGTLDFGDPGDGHFDFEPEESFTYMVWARIDRDTGTNENLVYKGGATQGETGYSSATQLGFDTVAASISGDSNGEYAETPNFGFVPRVFEHHAVVVDREAGRMTYYVDGVASDSVPIAAAMNVNDPPGNDYRLQISGFGGDFFLDGALDEFWLLDRALPSAVIQAFVANLKTPEQFASVGRVESVPW